MNQYNNNNNNNRNINNYGNNSMNNNNNNMNNNNNNNPQNQYGQQANNYQQNNQYGQQTANNYQQNNAQYPAPGHAPVAPGGYITNNAQSHAQNQYGYQLPTNGTNNTGTMPMTAAYYNTLYNNATTTPLGGQLPSSMISPHSMISPAGVASYNYQYPTNTSATNPMNTQFNVLANQQFKIPQNQALTNTQTNGSGPNHSKIQELVQLVDAVGSESTASDDEQRATKKRNTGPVPDWQNRRSKKLSGKPPSAKRGRHGKSTETPKFTAARESRKRAGDATDFAMESESNKDQTEEDSDDGMVFNEYDANESEPEDDSEDDPNLVVLDDGDDDDDNDGEGITGGGIIDESDSDEDDDDEEEDNYFNMNDDESDDSDDLPEAINAHNAMKHQFIHSASDTYVIMENQEKRNQFKRSSFKSKLEQIEKKKFSKKRRAFGNGHPDNFMYRSPENDIHEIIREEKKKKKEEKTKRIIHILKDLKKEGKFQNVTALNQALHGLPMEHQQQIMAATENVADNGSPMVADNDEERDEFNENEVNLLQLIAEESVKPLKAAKSNKAGASSTTQQPQSSNKPTLGGSKSVDYRKFPAQHNHRPSSQGKPQFMSTGDATTGSTQFSSHYYGHNQNYGPPPTHYGPNYYYGRNDPLSQHGHPLDNVEETVQSGANEAGSVHSMTRSRLVDHHSHNSHLDTRSMQSQGHSQPPNLKINEYRLEGLADSGPNCAVDHMQDRIRLRQLLRKQKHRQHSISETKSSAIKNRKKLNAKLAKMKLSTFNPQFNDEDKLVDDELFRETAKLLKSNSDRRKYNTGSPRSPSSRRHKQSSSSSSKPRTAHISSMDHRYQANKPYISPESNAVPPLPSDHEKQPIHRPTLRYYHSDGPPDQQPSPHHPYNYRSYGGNSHHPHHLYNSHHHTYYQHNSHYHQHLSSQQGSSHPHNAHYYQQQQQQQQQQQPPPPQHGQYPPDHPYHHQQHHGQYPMPGTDPHTNTPSKDKYKKEKATEDPLLSYLGAYDSPQPPRTINKIKTAFDDKFPPRKPVLPLHQRSSPPDFLYPQQPQIPQQPSHSAENDATKQHHGPQQHPFSNAFADANYKGNFPPHARPMIDAYAVSNPVHHGSPKQKPPSSHLLAPTNGGHHSHHHPHQHPHGHHTGHHGHSHHVSSVSPDISNGSSAENLPTHKQQHQQLRPNIMMDSYSYHPFSRGDDDQKKPKKNTDEEDDDDNKGDDKSAAISKPKKKIVAKKSNDSGNTKTSSKKKVKKKSKKKKKGKNKKSKRGKKGEMSGNETDNTSQCSTQQNAKSVASQSHGDKSVGMDAIDNEWICPDYEDNESSAISGKRNSFAVSCSSTENKAPSDNVQTHDAKVMTKDKKKKKSVNKDKKGLKQEYENQARISSRVDSAAEDNGNDDVVGGKKGKNNKGGKTKSSSSAKIKLDLNRSSVQKEDEYEESNEPKLRDRASKPMTPLSPRNGDNNKNNDDDAYQTPKMSQSRNSVKAPRNQYAQINNNNNNNYNNRRNNNNNNNNRKRNKNRKNNNQQQQYRQYNTNNNSNNNNNIQQQQNIQQSNISNNNNFNQYQQQTVNMQQQNQSYSQPQQYLYNQYQQNPTLSSGANPTTQTTTATPLVGLPYLSSVPMANTAPPLNRATTAPPTNNPTASTSNTQLKQLENTVEQLKSHFVQLLQQLPLTNAQQHQFNTVHQMNNLLSNPNTATSPANANMYSQFSQNTRTAPQQSNPSYSTPNIGLSSVSASNLLNTNGANIIIAKKPSTSTNYTNTTPTANTSMLLSPNNQQNNTANTPMSMTTPTAYSHNNSSTQRSQTSTTNYASFGIPNPSLSSIPLALAGTANPSMLLSPTNTANAYSPYNPNRTTANPHTATTAATNPYLLQNMTGSVGIVGTSSTPNSMQMGGLYANPATQQNTQQMNFNNMNMHHQ